MWIRALERIFNFLQCTNRERLTCVAFQLTGSADFWWEARRKTMTPAQLEHMTWEEFKNGVYDKYIPKSYRKAKEFEFYNLKQGHMTMTEYDRTFCDMSRYAPEQVETDGKMAERFCAGLRHEIRMALASHRGLTYLESLSRALDIEEAMPKEKAPAPAAPAPHNPPQKNFRDKRKWDGNRKPQDNKRYQTAQYPPQQGQGQVAPQQGNGAKSKAPTCATCSKDHYGECWVKTRKCHNCGGEGHFARDCLRQNAGRDDRQNPPRATSATAGNTGRTK